MMILQNTLCSIWDEFQSTWTSYIVGAFLCWAMDERHLCLLQAWLSWSPWLGSQVQVSAWNSMQVAGSPEMKSFTCRVKSEEGRKKRIFRLLLPYLLLQKASLRNSCLASIASVSTQQIQHNFMFPQGPPDSSSTNSCLYSSWLLSECLSYVFWFLCSV